MVDAKVIGYILSILGIVLIIFSNTLAKLSFFANMGTKALLYPIMGAIILIVAGIALIMSDGSSSKNIKQAENEVPIYEGEGKKRKIVGYQRAK